MREVIKEVIEDHHYYKKVELYHFGARGTERHGLCKWWYNDGSIHHANYFDGQLHGVDVKWNSNGEIIHKNYYLYDKPATKEEYRRHELIEELSGLKCEK